MFNLLLVMILIMIFAIPYFIQRSQIKSMINQINHEEEIRIPLNNKCIEELAASINKRVENKQKLQREIEIREENLKDSIASLSHDLRTPLTAIQGYITLLKDCTEEERERYLNIIETKTYSLQLLINKYYELSILEDKTTTVEIENVDITSVVTETIISNYTLFEEKNIMPQIELLNESIEIAGEKSYCERIVQNLIINAIKYSAGNVKVRLHHENRQCMFEVSNSVEKMTEEDLPKLFDKFYMVDQSRSKDGTGLGLYIVKLLLEKIDGEVIDVTLIQNIFTIRIKFELYDR